MGFPKTSREFHGRAKCVQGKAPVRVVTVHETQGTTARGGASTLTSRTDGSAHEVIGYDSPAGGLHCYKIADDDTILCHVGGQNTSNYGIEKAGISSWSKKWRLGNTREKQLLKFAAYRVAYRLRKHDLPCRYLSIRRLRKGDAASDHRGWTYHRNLSLAFQTSSHWDPGVPGINWPHGYFKTFVKFYYAFPHEREFVDYRDARRRLRKREH